MSKGKIYVVRITATAIFALLIVLSSQFAVQKAQKINGGSPLEPDAVDPATYSFTFGTDTLEDMSAGTTQLLGAGLDNAASAVTNIGFSFPYDGSNYTRFSVNTNGLMGLDEFGINSTGTNDLNSSTNNPKIAPYWDNICTGTGTGKVHYKLTGSSPNRKLVVEWRNMTIPFACGSPGTGTFQVWLNENGRIDYVYGAGIQSNANGYTIGITQATGVATNSGFASVTVPTSGNPTVSYTTENNSNTAAIAGGTKFSFSPNLNGTLSFSANNFLGIEGESAIITVNRIGGTSGAITVDYTLGGGTANGGAVCGAGVDYVNASGTVNFADGQTSQTFNVPLCADAVSDQNETFTATLSNPTGGANLGALQTATVTIRQPFTVTTVADEDGACDASCSLREAINAANSLSGKDAINFNITAGTAPFVIQPTTSLPEITETVALNGYSQPGASPNTLAVGSDANILIVLDGSLAGASGVGLELSSSNSIVKGLKLINWGSAGVWLSNGFPVAAGNNVIEGNHIRGVTQAMSIESTNNLIGGTTPAARNVLTNSGATDFVLDISGFFGFPTNTIRGNYIGTSPDGMTIDSAGLGGIKITSGRHLIIGNVIAGSATTSSSNGKGILVNTDGNTIQGNLIGVRADGTGSLPNQREGIQVGSFDNIIGGANPGEGNLIANNGSDGIFVAGGTGNKIRGNRIFSNGGLGIDLSPEATTANDGCDADNGANRLQNFPIIGSADSSGDNTTVTGFLNSTANQSFTVDFYANDSCDASGSGEGKNFLGSTVITTDAACNANFNQNFAVDLPLSQFITATATNNATGDTSEFSKCKQINSPPIAFVDLAITKTDSPDSAVVGSPLTYTLNVNNLSGNTATDVVVTDNLASSLSFVSVSAGCTHSSGTVTCNLGSIAGGANANAQIVVTPTTIGNVNNTATVATADVDTNTGNNSESETTTVIPALSATLTDAPDPVKTENNLTYTVTVTNNSATAGNNVQVINDLPFFSVTFVSASAGCTHSSGTVTCDLGTLNGGASATIQIVVSPIFSGTIPNSINVTSANLGTATASTTTTVVPAIPNADNYAFTTATDGSLTDMSNGTTTLIGENMDNKVSVVEDIGFDFFFFGDSQPFRYTRFFVNSNGSLRLLLLDGLRGESFTESGNFKPLSAPTQTFPVFAPFASDQETAANGKVHYKVVGSAPNRVLVVEWLNLETHPTDSAPNLTYQARLYETSGVIEYVYGSMTMSAAGAAAADSKNAQIGFAAARTAGKFGTVAAPQNGTPSYAGFTNTPVNNIYTAGAISVLTSSAQGLRRVFRFTPPAPAAPSNLTFSNVSETSMFVFWNDNSANENGFAVYTSTDGVNFKFARAVPQNSTVAHLGSLEAATNYTVRVYAVSESGLSQFVESSQMTLAPAANVISTATGGNWSNPGTWVGGVVPAANQNVTIASGATVIIDVYPNVYDLIVDGTLEYSSTDFTGLTVHSVLISPTGVFRTPETTNMFHTLSLTGNLINNGTLDFSSGSNTSVTVDFTGAADAVFGGPGAITDVYRMFVSKNVELNLTNFTVRGSSNDTTNGFLDLSSNVTFKISGSFSGTHKIFTSLNNSAGGNLWINNPNFTASFPGTTVSLNMLRISAGTFASQILSGRRIFVEGGAVNLGKLTAVSDYEQSGGRVTLGINMNFDVMSQIESLTMSGGLIVVQGGGQKNYTVYPTAVNLTGGTLQFGDSIPSGAHTFVIEGVLPNILISNAAGNGQIVRQIAGSVTVLGDINIQPGTVLHIQRSQNPLNGDIRFIHKGGSFTNNGALIVKSNATTIPPFEFNSAIPQLYAGSGTAGTNADPLATISVSNTSAGGLTIDSASPALITTRVNLFSGTIHNSNKIQLGTGNASEAIIQRGASELTGSAGNFDVPPTFNIGSGALTLAYFHGGANIATGNEVPPSRTVRRVAVSVPNGVTLGGGNLTLAPAAGFGSPSLELTNGIFDTGANTLIVKPGVTVTRTNGWVNGNLQMDYNATGAKTFHVGTTNGYSPVTANVTTLTTNPSSLTVKAVQGNHPNAPNAASALKRYWTLTETGDLTATLNFNYLQTDVPSVTESSLELKRFNGATFDSIPATLDTDANTAITTSGITDFSDWTLLAPLAPTAAKVWIGGRVVSADGRGIFGAQVGLIDATGAIRYARTNPFGFYRFADVSVGANYVFNVSHKRYKFVPRVLFVGDESDSINFIALPENALGDKP